MAREPLRVGIAYRVALASWVDRQPTSVDLVEVMAEHFYKGGEGRLRTLAQKYPLLLHTERLSLGTPGALDPNEALWLSAAAEAANPLWLSDHLAFSRTAEVDLGFPTPVPLTAETLKVMVEHTRAIVGLFDRPFLVENISAPLRLAGCMSESDFLNHLCEKSGCGLSVDLTALAVNGRNHAFDPAARLAALDPRHIVQLRVGSYRQVGGVWRDTNDGPVPEEVWDLTAQVLESAPVRAVILERDRNFPSLLELESELERLRATGQESGYPGSARGSPVILA